MKLLKPNKEDLVQFSNLLKSAFCLSIKDQGRRELLFGEAGKEHYALLCWMGHQFNQVLLCDIGTFWGGSALALSHNRWNQVLTFDRWPNPKIESLPANVLQNKIEHKKAVPLLKQAPLIFLDISHNGDDERWFVGYLRKINWKGLLVFDDIYFNDEMKKFWEQLDADKEDWSDIGHHSGTGLAYF